MRVFVLRLCALVTPVSLLFGSVVYNTVPSRIVGQAVLQLTTQTAIAPNLVEGREFDQPQSLAVDTSVSPPILYVADTANNRILAWKNATGFSNGQPADLVLGQHDMYSTLAQGPQVSGSDLIAGFNVPIAVAVDGAGNLYVADANDNRILRFPQPFNQTSDVFQPDLVIGQSDLSSFYPNQGATPPTAKSICLQTSGNVYRTGMTFDSSGNLFVSDACNNRVLRFPKAVLLSGTFAPAADLVLGQSTFGSNGLPSGGLDPTQKGYLAQPTGLAFDQEGRLYVADEVNRVVVFDVPVANGQAALRIMGVVTVPNSAPVSADTLGGTGGPPNDVVIVGDNPYVVDTGNNRILGYAPFSQWPTEASSFSPSASVLIGQLGTSYSSNSPNQGGVEASATSLSGPIAAVWTGSKLLVADSGNNRVLSFPQGSTQNTVATTATGVLGQTDFPYDAPNLIEGREFDFFVGNSSSGGVTVPVPGGAVVIDPATNHMFVSDPGNNRILGFADYRKVGPGTKADIVIGQPDFNRRIINYPGTTTKTVNGLIVGVPNSSGLWSPEGLALDASGNLWVADTGNSRALRFPPPFAQTGQIQANLVLGQADFVSSFTDPTSETMKAPYGVAVTATGQVLVSDISFNRILLFVHPAGGDFANGQGAAGVIGQSNYFSTTAGTAANNGLNQPRLMATDPQDDLYVADTGNNRIAIYANASTPATNPGPSFSLTAASSNGQTLASPVGVSVSSATGEVWVVDTGGNAVLQYASFSQLIVNPLPVSGVASAEPLAVTFDPFGNPVIADATNRVAFYYPVMNMQSSANYFLRYAPGMLSSLFSVGTATFGPTTVSAAAQPLPTTLGDVQVLVGGVAAPILYASPTQINFQIPMATALGTVEVQTVQASTGQVLTSNLFSIQAVAPALFTADGSGTGQLAAINAADNSVNSAKNPVKAGAYISLFGTGQGVVSGAPPDGTGPSGPVPTAQTPQVYINGPNYLDPSDVEYSGLAPDYVGLWQINAKVPADAPPGAVIVYVGLNGIYSLVDSVGDRVQTVIYVSAAQ